MGHDRSAAKRPANLNLDIDLVGRCRSGIDILAAPAEALLAADPDLWQARPEAAFDAFAAPYQDHGSLSEERQAR